MFSISIRFCCWSLKNSASLKLNYLSLVFSFSFFFSLWFRPAELGGFCRPAGFDWVTLNIKERKGWVLVTNTCSCEVKGSKQVKLAKCNLNNNGPFLVVFSVTEDLSLKDFRNVSTLEKLQQSLRSYDYWAVLWVFYGFFMGPKCF